MPKNQAVGPELEIPNTLNEELLMPRVGREHIKQPIGNAKGMGVSDILPLSGTEASAYNSELGAFVRLGVMA